MNVRKPILENEIYCEILSAIGRKRLSVSQLVAYFTDEFTGKVLKSQPAIREQVLLLEKKGFLSMTLTDEKGKKYPKNQKKFYINFEKIVEEFIKHISIERKSDELMKNKEKYISNQYLVRFFENIFDIENIRNVSNLFSDIQTYEVLKIFRDDYIENLNLKFLKNNKWKMFKKIFAKRFGNRNMMDFVVFEEFIDHIDSGDKIDFYRDLSVDLASTIFSEIYGQEEHSKVVIGRNTKDEFIEYKFYKEFENISLDEVKRDLESIRILKERKKRDKDEMIHLIRELRDKYYFIYPTNHFMDINDDSSLNKIDYKYLKRNLLSLEYRIILTYDLIDSYDTSLILNQLSKTI